MIQRQPAVAQILRQGVETLGREDPALFGLLERESQRQQNILAMVAASSVADPSVLVCEATATANVTTEGYPGARFHAGCEVVDEIERLAIERAKTAFGARYANVQPHSGSSANAVVIFSLLRPGETILGMELGSGGHLTHGAPASVVGQYFNAVGYGVDERGLIDYDQVRRLALAHRPKLIICGASAYPRTIDFAAFREIADRAGAYLMADISHIAGLVAAGEHPSPIDHAHFTTTSTYKQLFGPRGGLVLMGRDHESPEPNGKGSLSNLVQRAIFPFFQGTPHLNGIAAKARALGLVGAPEFKKVARRIVADAKALSDRFLEEGYRVLTGGTDNHMVLIDVWARGITGVIAERALEECNVIINKNKIAGDKKSAFVTSGIRLGTNSLALRGMGPDEMSVCAGLIHGVLSSLEVHGDKSYTLIPVIKASVRARVEELCGEFPLPRYPAAAERPAENSGNGLGRSDADDSLAASPGEASLHGAP